MATLTFEDGDALNFKNIQKIIKTARKVQGLSQKELGLLVGVSPAQICKIEKGYENATFSTIRLIFHALGVVATLKPIELKPNDARVGV